MSDHIQAVTEMTTDHGQLTTDRQKTIHMKTNRILFLALLVSALLAVSVEAGDRHRNNNGNAPAVRSGSAHYSGGSSVRSSGSFRVNSGRTFASSPRMTTRSMPQFSQHSTFNSGGNVASFSQRQFTPRTFNRSNDVARFQNNGNLGALQNNRVSRFSSLDNSHHGLNKTVAGNRLTRFENKNNLGTVKGSCVIHFVNIIRGYYLT